MEAHRHGAAHGVVFVFISLFISDLAPSSKQPTPFHPKKTKTRLISIASKPLKVVVVVVVIVVVTFVNKKN